MLLLKTVVLVQRRSHLAIRDAATAPHCLLAPPQQQRLLPLQARQRSQQQVRAIQRSVRAFGCTLP